MDNTDAKQMKYEQAMAELNDILRDMQSGQCDIDSLAKMTRRATELLAACRAKLTATEEELSSILDQLTQAE